MARVIGRIMEVKGIGVKARLSDLLPPFLISNGICEIAPKINSLIKTKVGIDIIICQVTGEYCEEIDGKVSNHFLDLVVKGYIDGQNFIQGLRMLPIVSANIEILEIGDYMIIYSTHNENDMKLGVDLYDSGRTINVDINKLIPSHVGIFGNTGSGKSNTLAKILREFIEITKDKDITNSKLLLFDLNNEYSGDAICKLSQKELYNLKSRVDSEKKIPFEFSKLSEDDFVVFLNASLKMQAPIVKIAYKNMIEDSREKAYYQNFIKSILNNGRKSLFLSLRHYLINYVSGLDNFYYHNIQGNFYYMDSTTIIYFEKPEFQEKLKLIEVTIPDDKLDRFLFELYFAVAQENENGANLDYILPLISRAGKLISNFKKVFDFTSNANIFNGKRICIIQLANVNKDMREAIPTIISNCIMGDMIEMKGDGSIKNTINIIIDEAHNLLYDDEDDSVAHKNVIDVFERIVKEGRKFGLFLYLASQRPSDISNSVISQLHNYFIHKLVNPSDLLKIRKAVAFLDENSINFITILAPGECIVSGTAFQMPTFMYISQLEDIYRPNSENVVLLGDGGILEKKGS